MKAMTDDPHIGPMAAGADRLQLGPFYQHGLGVAPDLIAAVRWYRGAAESEVSEAMYAFGLMHLIGRGVARDIVMAYVWLARAAVYGNDEAHHESLVVQHYMTPEQHQRAQHDIKPKR